MMGYDMRRKIPDIQQPTLRKWLNGSNFKNKQVEKQCIVKVYLFVGEFTEYYDVLFGAMN